MTFRKVGGVGQSVVSDGSVIAVFHVYLTCVLKDRNLGWNGILKILFVLLVPLVLFMISCVLGMSLALLNCWIMSLDG